MFPVYTGINRSIKLVSQTKNEELAKIIHEMDYIPWIAVSTPRGVYAHEMGHALHYLHKEEIDNIINKLWGEVGHMQLVSMLNIVNWNLLLNHFRCILKIA